MPHRRVVGELHHLLDQRLAAVVGGVRLARDDQLHRALRVEQQRPQPVRVAQHQREPLVGRHPAGEPDGEHVGVEAVRSSPARRPTRRAAATTPGPGGAPPRPAGLRSCERDPQSCPVSTCCSRCQTVGSLGTEPEQLAASSSHCGAAQVGAVHAVGDRADRHLAGVEARPQLAEHVAADARRAACDTPLARWASRRPMCAMLNIGGRPRRRARGSGPAARRAAAATSA